MTVVAVESMVVYTGYGTTSAFDVAVSGVPIPFSFSSDIKAETYNTVTGATTPLVEGTDYTLTPIVSGVAGVLTLTAGNLATGLMLGIYRDEAISQGSTFNGAAFPAAAVERAIDTQCRISQQIANIANRSLSISRFDSYPDASLEIPISREGCILGFDATGNVSAYLPSDFDAGISGTPCAISHLVYAGGSALSTGYAGEQLVPFAMTITGWVLIADAAGQCVVDIWKSDTSTFPPASSASSIAATPLPSLSAARSAYSTSVSGWQTDVAAGSLLSCNIGSISGITSLNVIITGVRA